MASSSTYLVSWLLILYFAAMTDSFDLANDHDEGMTPICQISRCFCDQATRTVLCRHVIFPNLPKFPFWTETLKLAENHLTLLKSRSFEGLHRLQRIYLSSNDLEMLEEDAFDGLSELSILDLSHNRIRNIPRDLFHSTPRLSVLNVSGNPLEDLSIFEAFPAEMRLNELIMRDIEFGCCPRTEPLDFPQTERVDFSGTKFHSFNGKGLVMKFGSRGDVRTAVFKIEALTNAIELDLFDCQAIIARNFLDTVSSSVKMLNIGRNSIEGDVLGALDRLGGFPKLETLNVSGITRAGGSKQPILDRWTVFPVPIKILDISFLGIRNISFDAVRAGAGRELQVLKATNNFLYTLHLASDLKRLERVELSGNQLVFFPSADNEIEFAELTILDLSDNLLAHVDEQSLRPYPNLRILRLSKNRIAMIDSKAFVFACCGLLETLDLSHNALEHLPRMRLPSLRNLNLSNNRLVGLEKGGVLATAKRLEELDLSDNHELMIFLGRVMVNCTNEENCIGETWLGELIGLSMLRRFSAARVGFSHFPVIPFNSLLTRIRDIDLSDNSITSEDWENVASSLPSKPCVRSLHLAYNKLTRLRNMTLLKNDCLENLDLSSNPFICDCHIETVVSILRTLPAEEDSPHFNDTRYYCFSSTGGAYRRVQFHELGAPNGLKLACSVQDIRQKSRPTAEATAIGFYAILGVLLGSATFVVLAICCRACLLAAHQYVRAIRQQMYEPLRVIITSDLASPAGTPSML